MDHVTCTAGSHNDREHGINEIGNYQWLEYYRHPRRSYVTFGSATVTWLSLCTPARSPQVSQFLVIDQTLSLQIENYHPTKIILTVEDRIDVCRVARILNSIKILRTIIRCTNYVKGNVTTRRPLFRLREALEEEFLDCKDSQLITETTPITTAVTTINMCRNRGKKKGTRIHWRIKFRWCPWLEYFPW